MFISILIFIFGSVWGSFFYTLALRLSESQGKANVKMFFSLSKCPQCSSGINPLFMIPVLGYFLSRGKCSKCNAAVSVLYPASEVFYGLIAILFYINFGASIYAFILFLIAGLAIAVSFVDLKIMIIPDSLLIGILVLSVYPVLFADSYMDNLYGLLMMGIFFIVILLVFPGSFGGGDLKFACLIGLLLGLERSILALELALITGSVIGVAYALLKRKGFRIRMAFAPYLTAGLIITLLYGTEIILIYFRIFY